MLAREEVLAMECAMTPDEVRQRIDKAFVAFQTDSVRELRPEQRRVIERIVGGGRTLALFPTGSGKSLCYQVSGRALGGTTIVISPLIALMDEQAEQLTRLGRKAHALHAQIPPEHQLGLLKRWHHDEIDIEYLFLSPERLAMNVLVQQALRAKASRIRLVAIDEAHCISEWGDDFRPLYTMIPATLDSIFGSRLNWPSVLAMTATIGVKDLEVIQTDFGITHCERHADLLRESIHLEVRRYANEKEKIAALWTCLAETGGERTVAFHYKIRGENGVEDLAEQACQRGLKAAPFHARLTMDAKRRTIESFRSGETKILFATSAFGLGMDIPNIRNVLHIRPPPSIEEYYQQVGRAGRDGKPAKAIALYTGMNHMVRKLFLDTIPDDDKIKAVFSQIIGRKGQPGFKSQNPWDEDEETLACVRYLQLAGTIRIVGPGITNLGDFTSNDPAMRRRLTSLADASQTGDLVITAKRLGEDPCALSREIGDAVLTGEVSTAKSIKQVMVLEVPDGKIDDVRFAEACRHRNQVRTAKSNDLDHIARIFDEYKDSSSLHRQVAAYLGYSDGIDEPKFDTAPGIRVRSKNEVIIANALHHAGISFDYELDIVMGGKTWSPGPDFTIRSSGLIWEHLGMLDRQNYRRKWVEKRTQYEKHRPGKVIITHDQYTLGGFVDQIMKWIEAGDVPFAKLDFDWQLGIGMILDPHYREQLLVRANDAPNPGQPVGSHELIGNNGDIVAQADLAFPDHKPPIAIVSDTESESAYRAAGWMIISLSPPEKS